MNPWSAAVDGLGSRGLLSTLTVTAGRAHAESKDSYRWRWIEMNGRMGRIVVGFDGSTQAAHAVQWAAAEAVRRERLLNVLYVVDYGRFVTGDGSSGGVGWAPHLADEPSRLLVAKGVEMARKAAPDVQVTGDVEVGRPIGALFEASRTADLMVVGTRGYTELANLAVGSVAASMAAHARCP